MVFSRKAFLSSDTGRMNRRLLSAHLDTLDGLPVTKEEGRQCGTVRYTFDGEEWELYPVMPEWCVEDSSRQITLFDD